MTQVFPYDLDANVPVQIGLVVLQSDETIELDFRRLIPLDIELLVTRIPSAEEVTRESLATMEDHLAGAASLFPRSVNFASIGYACTSGTAQIGADRIAALVSSAVSTQHVTNPVTSLIAACRMLGVKRLGLLSPYCAPVSARLQDVLAAEGIETPTLGSFDVIEEARVARINGSSITSAAQSLVQDARIDALFLSCTNLRTLDVITEIEAAIDLPVLSSNQVLAWHLTKLAGKRVVDDAPGRLFHHS